MPGDRRLGFILLTGDTAGPIGEDIAEVPVFTKPADLDALVDAIVSALLFGGQMPLKRLKEWAAALKRDIVALWLAATHPEVPWHAKAAAGAVAAYALSPIDLIPDFIPVLGYLDDLVIVPLGIVLAVRLIPPPLMETLRREAEAKARPTSLAGLAAILAIWAAAITSIALSWR